MNYKVLYKKSRFLHVFTRNEILFLVNCLFMRPLQIKKGKKIVLSLIEKETIIPNKRGDKESKILTMLLKHKIVVPYDDPEIIQETKNRNKFSALSLYLLVSQACNLSCIYCLAGKQKYRTNEKMSNDVICMALEKASQHLNEGGELQIIFFGGEPMLNVKAIAEGIKYVNDRLKLKYPSIKYRFHITTNLTKLTNYAQELIKRNNISILTDVDGAEIEHNKLRPFSSGKSSYASIIKNIQKLNKANVPISVRTTVTSTNVQKLDEIFKHHCKLGIKRQGYPILIPVDSDGKEVGSELYPDLNKFAIYIAKMIRMSFEKKVVLLPFGNMLDRVIFQHPQVYGCGMPLGNTAVVNAQGDVYPCIYLVGEKRFYLGNIHDEAVSFNYSFDEYHVDKITDCKDCKFKYLCGGGCVIRIMQAKNLSKQAFKYFTDITCTMTKIFFEEICCGICQIDLRQSLKNSSKGKNRGGSPNFTE